MRTALSKLLLSNPWRRICYQHKAYILERCVPSNDFSTRNNPRRPMRGEMRRDDRSEDIFLRGLNFGDDDGVKGPQRAHREAFPDRPYDGPSLRGAQQRKKEPPLREEDGIDGAADDLLVDFDLADRTGRVPPGHTRTSVRRDPPREDFGPSPQSQFKDFGGDYFEGSGSSQQKARPPSADGRRVDKSDVVDQTPPTVAKSAAEEAPPEDADEIFKKMKETGLIPNAVAMLDGLCKDGLIQEAMKLFGSMREKGTMPEVVIYTAAVEGFCKAARFDDAKRIFRKMQKNGIVPNAFSYKVLIQGLCKGKKLEDSVEFCMEMLDAGHSPNVTTLVDVVDGFCREKGVEEAADVVKRLRERDFDCNKGGGTARTEEEEEEELRGEETTASGCSLQLHPVFDPPYLP
ncbi:hypothetical protein C4D60_Mb08t24620 [Musa balbisiana]|uniref:Pentacotripeptide-repeat region of PRORP domain-containing protein n=1 Tax=Musa balbisiana TaxID=52838 RepID=A0A4S8K698_MUSBA|nr:hypothetical protein C4D60_Mb08t24620 [Musa balbisiana]